MRNYQAKDLSAIERYKLLSGAVVPRPIAWITSQNEQGLVNAAPFSFFNVVSSEPAVLSVSIMGDKDTYENIMKTKQAVVQLVNTDNVAKMNETSATLPADVSEPAQFDLDLVPSRVVAVPALAISTVRYECKLYQHIPVGSNNLMLLEVVNFSFAENVLNPENLHIDVDKLAPIARLAGNDYAELGKKFMLVRPK